MDQDETGCQAPEGPILCINNCGFFGSAATMNMCSKCHKDKVLNEENAKLAASSIKNIVNNCNSIQESSLITGNPNFKSLVAVDSVASSSADAPIVPDEGKSNERPGRCGSCQKRVGLTGFKCRCGSTFCAVHRYSDKHDCKFDYRGAAREAINKANPVVKAEKLDKI